MNWRGLLPVLIGAWLAAPALGQPYRLPYDAEAIRAAQPSSSNRPAACPDLVDAPRQLQHEPRFRGAGNFTVIDPERHAAELAAVEPVRQFNRIVSNVASRALRDPAHTQHYRRCVLRHLDHWASHGAFTGENSLQGEFEKKWSSITAALGYLDSRSEATPAQSGHIEDWLRQMGVDVWRHYRMPIPQRVFSSRTNNHAYWAALSTTAIGIALSDKELFDWGMNRFLSALSDIDNRGLLRHELRRKQLALSYHRFALEPLLLLRLIAAANDIPVAPELDESLRRLAEQVKKGLLDPVGFAAYADHEQAAHTPPRPFEWAWAELALALWPDADLRVQIDVQRPYFHNWLGGDVTLRYDFLARTADTTSKPR